MRDNIQNNILDDIEFILKEIVEIKERLNDLETR